MDTRSRGPGPSFAPLPTLIDLAPGAEDNPLAGEVAARIRDNLEGRPRKLAHFRALRGSIHFVAQDVGEALTLRFDHGRLTLHDGTVGVPAVTFCGDLAALRRLVDLGFAPEGRAAVRHLAALFARGDLKVYGLLAHPRTVVLLLRVLSSGG